MRSQTDHWFLLVVPTGTPPDTCIYLWVQAQRFAAGATVVFIEVINVLLLTCDFVSPLLPSQRGELFTGSFGDLTELSQWFLP